MPLINPSLPTIGQPNSSEEPKIVTDLSAILGLVNGGLDNANIASAAGIVDTKLASPNNALWRTVRSTNWGLPGGTGPGTYMFNQNGSIVPNGSNNPTPSGLITIPSLTDYAVAGKTAQARIVVHSMCNATAPGVTVGFGLYPVSAVSGASTLVNITLGAGIAGSFANLTATASTAEQAAGSAFTLPSGSTYIIGVQWATTVLANASACGGIADLQVRFT